MELLLSMKTVLQYYNYRDDIVKVDFPNIFLVKMTSCPFSYFFTAQYTEIGGCL